MKQHTCLDRDGVLTPSCEQKKGRSRAPSADADLQKALELSRQEFERQQTSQSEDRVAEEAGRTAAPNAACEKQAVPAGNDQPNRVADETGDTIPDSEEDESPVESDVHVANGEPISYSSSLAPC